MGIFTTDLITTEDTLKSLPVIVQDYMTQNDITQRDAAYEIGISMSTLAGLLRGQHIRSDTIMKTLHWLRNG